MNQYFGEVVNKTDIALIRMVHTYILLGVFAFRVLLYDLSGKWYFRNY